VQYGGGLNVDESVWVKLQVAISDMIENSFPGEHLGTIEGTADAIAHKVCGLLLMPEIVQDTNYEKWAETKKTLFNLFEAKEDYMNLKQRGEELGREREALIAELEEAESRSTIIPIVESLHTNKKLIKANQEAIDAANKD
jgi:predicted nuclease with TOPRIM domain